MIVECVKPAGLQGWAANRRVRQEKGLVWTWHNTTNTFTLWNARQENSDLPCDRQAIIVEFTKGTGSQVEVISIMRGKQRRGLWSCAEQQTGGSRLIRIWIIRIPEFLVDLKSYPNDTPVSAMLICSQNANIASLKRKSLGIFISNIPDPPTGYWVLGIGYSVPICAERFAVLRHV